MIDAHRTRTAGYFIVIGLGLVFSLLTSGMVWLDDKFGGASSSSESFSTAGRSIKMGLTACDIVSKWTWAATLLQSSNVAWQFGVSGPFWYASGEYAAAAGGRTGSSERLAVGGHSPAVPALE